MKEATVLYSNDVMLENGDIMKLHYSLTENVSESDQKRLYYGVRVTKCLNDQVETEEVPGVSSSRETVVAILKKLCDYIVTPISLVEILDDMETQEEFTAQDELLVQGI